MRKIIGLIFKIGFSVLILSSCQTSEKEKEKAELRLKLGVSYYQSANYPQALAELQKANELDPENQYVQNNLGLTYFMREKLDLAEKFIKKALDIDPKYTDARNNLVRVYIEQKDYRKAQSEMDKVFADLTYGGLERAYINQGLIDFNQKKYSHSEKSFSKAVEYQKDSCTAYNYWGRSVFEQADYARASRSLDRAISFCQKVLVDEPHYYSALSYYRAGDVDRSKARFEEITRIYPNGKYFEKSKQMLDLIRKAQ